jgi:type IV fimbrial biogenesis protein FimT
MNAQPAGFSLIELMVTISIFAILVLLAMPSFSEYLQNTQIRTATESVLNGVRLAQAEAVKRNGPVSLIVDPLVGWQIVGVDPSTLADLAPALQSFNLAEGAPKATLTLIPPTATRVTFSGLGRVMNPNPSGPPTPLTRVDVTNTTLGSPHRLSVVIGALGIKMCDPSFTLPDPVACP